MITNSGHCGNIYKLAPTAPDTRAVNTVTFSVATLVRYKSMALAKDASPKVIAKRLGIFIAIVSVELQSGIAQTIDVILFAKEKTRHKSW